MTKSVLIIRTEPNAAKTAKRVRDIGFAPIILPCAIAVATNCDIDIENVQALLITSSNAPRLAKLNAEILKIPVYAVGDATAKTCEEYGFSNIVSAGGDASALGVLVADRLKAKDGALLHLRGQDVAGDIKGLLEACGFEVKNATIYETIDNKDFVEKLPEIISQNSGYVLFYSPNGAQRFAKFLRHKSLKNWVAIGISNAAIEAIKNLDWQEIIVSEKPNDASMLLEISHYKNIV